MMKLLLVLWCVAALTACADMAKQNTAAGFVDSKQAAKNEKIPPDGHDTPQRYCFWVNDHCYGEPYEEPRPDEYHEPGKLPPKLFGHGGSRFKPPHYHHGDAGRRMPR